MTKEKNISNAIIRALHARYPTAHMRKRLNTGFSGTTGWPDITGHIGGIHIEIEVKQPGHKPRKLQVSRIRRFNRGNAIAIWTDSVESCLRKIDFRLENWKPL